MKIKTQLKTFADNAKAFGLDNESYKHSLEFIEHHEFGLAFDTIITQLYEYDIAISNAFYAEAVLIANKMQLSDNEFIYLKQLVA